MLEYFWLYADRLTIFFSLVAAIFAFSSWFKLVQQNKRLIELARNTPKIESDDERIEFHSKINSINPVAVAISLIPSQHSIKNDVNTFLNYKNWKMKIEELIMDGINTRTDLIDYVNKLRELKRTLSAEGTTELLLFIQGPVMSGVLAGAVFDNWIPVKLYHKPTPPKPQIYEYWMPILK